MNYEAMRFVAEACTVKGAGRALLWAIAFRADLHSGECWAALRRLASEAGIDYATAKRVKPELINLGLLEVIVHGSGRRPDCVRILTTSGCATPPIPAVENPVDMPVDNSVVGASDTPSGHRSGRIDETVVGAPRASPIRNEGKNVEGVKQGPTTTVPDWRAAMNAPQSRAG